MFVILALVDDRLVIDSVVNKTVKNESLLPGRLYMHALVDDSVGLLAVTPDMFVILALVEDRFVIEVVATDMYGILALIEDRFVNYAAVNLAIRNDAFLSYRLYIHAYLMRVLCSMLLHLICLLYCHLLKTDCLSMWQRNML